MKEPKELKDLAEEKEVVVVGFFKDQSSKDAKAFLQAADGERDKSFFPKNNPLCLSSFFVYLPDNDEQTFVITSEQKVLDEYKVKKDGSVVLLKKFDDGRADYEGEMEAEAINKFVKSEALPLINEFSSETAPKIFGTDVQVHFLLLASKSDDKFDGYVKAITAAAKKHKGKIIFVTLDAGKDDNKQVLEFFGMKAEDCPEYLIYEVR